MVVSHLIKVLGIELSPLEEQFILLTTESSLQSLEILLKYRFLILGLGQDLIFCIFNHLLKYNSS